MPQLGLGLGLQRGIPTFSGLLNAFPGAAAAYSLRRLGAYSGPVVRARRVNTPAEADFTAAQIDNGELATWALSGDAFVAIWYDQSGLGNDATQATTTMQPKIVDAGSLVVGGLDFDGVDDFFESVSNFAVTQPISFFAVANQNLTSTYFSIGAGTQDLNVLVSGGGNVAMNGGSPLVSAGTVNGALSLVSGIADGVSSELFIDGSSSASGDAGGGPSGAAGKLFIGDLASSARPADCTMEEMIIYASDQSTNRVGIETNINAHYAIF